MPFTELAIIHRKLGCQDLSEFVLLNAALVAAEIWT